MWFVVYFTVLSIPILMFVAKGVDDIQIINDRSIGGKCYAFVTFTNPRSAMHAINEMDGQVFISLFLSPPIIEKFT